jgi:4-diphosphocytidyl-2C-methyl-D-erythritol kinase
MRKVAEAGGEPRMTGSGSTIFALTDDPGRAGSIAAALGRAGVQVTRTRLRLEPAEIVELDEASPDAGAPAPGMG